MNKMIILVLSLILLSGCGGGDSNNTDTTSSLVGVWVTESCEQASDSNGTLQNIWIKGLYEFTNQGKVLLGKELYLDSNCITISSTQTPAEQITPITYKDQGSRLLQEGINGGGLQISNQSLSIDAFYTINNNSLCFSDAFTFEALKFGISQSGTDAIDFNKCLTTP